MFVFIVPNDGVSYTSLSIYYKNDTTENNFLRHFEFGSCFINNYACVKMLNEFNLYNTFYYQFTNSK